MVKTKQQKSRTNFLSDIFLDNKKRLQGVIPRAGYFCLTLQNHFLLSTHLYFVPSQSVKKLTFMECIKRFSCPLASDGVWQCKAPAEDGKARGG